MSRKQPPPGQEPAETRPLYVEDWIHSLPYANPNAVVQAVRKAISALNETPITGPARVELLELYAGPYKYLLESRTIGRTAHSIAAFERNRQAVEALRRLAVEMAYGYKLALNDYRDAQGRWTGDKPMGFALQRTLMYLSQVLMHSYHEYLPVPPNVWKELKELYWLAREHGLAELGVPSEELPTDFALSLSHGFKRILLVGLVDPYYLSYGQVWEVFDTVGDWAAEASLVDHAPEASGAGYFVIDMSRDARPTAFIHSRSEDLGRICCFLNANPVLKKAQERIAEIKQFSDATYAGTSDTPQRSSISLLRRMTRAWGLPPKRHAPRMIISGEVNLASGLPALHYFLSGCTIQVQVPGPGAESDIIVSSHGSIVSDEPADSRRSPYGLEAWSLLNEGPSGVGLLKSRRPSQLIRVGEIIGMQETGSKDSDGAWTVGVIRWLVVRQTGEYLAGVQILGSRPQAVLVRRALDATPRTALMLPADPETQTKGTVIAPHGTYEPGVRLFIEGGEQRSGVRADSLLEITVAYEQFNYEATSMA